MSKSLLTSRKIESLLKWGLFCSASEEYKWTKFDKNLFDLAMEEIKRQRHENYLKRQRGEYV